MKNQLGIAEIFSSSASIITHYKILSAFWVINNVMNFENV